MLFYMAVRYEGDNGEIDLELNEKVNNNKDPYMGKLSVLLKWNEQDPVDDLERKRNEVILQNINITATLLLIIEWVNKIWN